jgi:hypothetical protein
VRRPFDRERLQSLGQAPSDQDIRLIGPTRPGALLPRISVVRDEFHECDRLDTRARQASPWASESDLFVPLSPPAAPRAPIPCRIAVRATVTGRFGAEAGDGNLGARNPAAASLASRIDAGARPKVYTSGHQNLLMGLMRVGEVREPLR